MSAATVAERDARTTGDPLRSPVVLLRDVGKNFGGVEAVRQVDLEVRDGEFFTLLGPSGSGKTTILRMIAGLVEPSEGTIEIEGEDVTRRRPYERNIAMVFQSLALIPHMDVFSNVAFPLRMRRIGRQQIARSVADVLAKVGLAEMGERKVDELSGGQRQRVALARALVYEPSLLLLDEPFGALDRRVREEMQGEVRRLHRDFGVTIVNVTHDQQEALRLSDRIAVVDSGRIAQQGTPVEIYRRPADRFVASFLGDPSLINGHLVVGEGGVPALRTDGALELAVANASTEGPAAIVLRSEAVSLRRPEEAAPAGTDNELDVEVLEAVFEGAGVYYLVHCEQHDIEVNVFAAGVVADPLRPGEKGLLGWSVDDAPVVGSAR